MRLICQLVNETIYLPMAGSFLYSQKNNMKHVIKGTILAIILLSFLFAIIAIA
jgi:hypothetical protein